MSLPGAIPGGFLLLALTFSTLAKSLRSLEKLALAISSSATIICANNSYKYIDL